MIYKRKRLGKTDYKKRLKLLTANKPRLVVRKSNKNFIVQFAEFNGSSDKITTSSHSNELKKYGWNLSKSNAAAAYLTGLLGGIKARKKNVNEAILDIGLYISIRGSNLYAMLKGVLDSGINIPHSKDILPKEDRIKGIHIENYAKKIDKEKYDKQFSGYVKKNLKPEEVVRYFEETKKRIMENERRK